MTSRWLLLLSIVCCLGCGEWEESIVVSPSGAVEVRYEIVGNAADLDNGEARLPTSDRFELRRFTRPKGDATEDVLIATANFDSAEAMPQTFGGTNPDYTQGLHFSTAVKVTERPDGTHYLFVRDIRRRQWAAYESDRRHAIPAEIDKLLSKGPLEELTRGERTQVLEALREYEIRKNIRWGQEALHPLNLETFARLEASLELHHSIRQRLSTDLSLPKMEALLELAPKALDAEVSQLQRRWDLGTVALIRERHSLKASEAEGYATAIREARMRYQVTEDLADESFKLKVTLPGTLISHNGDGQEGSTVTWSWQAKDVFDQDRVLIAHSVLKN